MHRGGGTIEDRRDVGTGSGAMNTMNKMGSGIERRDGTGQEWHGASNHSHGVNQTGCVCGREPGYGRGTARCGGAQRAAELGPVGS